MTDYVVGVGQPHVARSMAGRMLPRGNLLMEYVPNVDHRQNINQLVIKIAVTDGTWLPL